MTYYILRDCKKTGREDRLRPDFDNIDDAKANCEILKTGDRQSLYWVRFESEPASALKALVIESLKMRPTHTVIGTYKGMQA